MLKPVEWLLRQIGVSNSILFLLLLFVAGLLISVLLNSFLAAICWASISNLCAILILMVFRSELRAFIALIYHVGNRADKDDVLSASDGLFAEVEKPMLRMLRELLRKESGFDNVVREIQHSASELSSNAGQLSKNTAGQSISTGSTAAAVTEIGHSIEEITQRIRDVLETSQHARHLCERGSASVESTRLVVDEVAVLAKETRQQVNQLAEESKEVTSISKDIVGIADQTSLLALNAAIEAARAGEHGRGFSVVADEVRALSDRSHSSAQVISNKIDIVNSCMTRVEQSMENVLARVEQCLQETVVVDRKLKQISESSDSLSQKISAIATASEQQIVAAREISEHIERVSVAADENSYMANQTAEVSNYLVLLTSSETH